MNLNRKSLKDSEKKSKAELFIDAADDAPKRSGRPKTNKETTKPVSISLTESDRKLLDSLPRRFNLLSYQLDPDKEVQLTRTDIVRLMAKYLNELPDDKYLNMINNILK